MGLSRDQKRKAKLKKRAERSHKQESLAYSGNKYRTDRFTPVVYATEVGIHEVSMVSERTLTDRDVEAALVRLVTQMRQGPLPPLSDSDEPVMTAGEWDEAIILMIRRHWRNLQEEGRLPARDDLIGVLRTILHSIEVWRSKSMHSQAYLRFLEGFMKKLGVSVRHIDEFGEPLEGPEEEDEEEPLLALGREWVLTHDQRAEIAFADQVEATIRSGHPERVIDVCQQLVGEAMDSSLLLRLEKLAIRGHMALEERGRHAGPSEGTSRLPSPRGHS